jgi:chromatin structure-remodeling complex subunit SFH1
MSRPNTPSGAYERNLQTWSTNPAATPAGATASQRAVRSRKSAANANVTASSRSPAPSRLQSQQPVPPPAPIPAPQPIVQNAPQGLKALPHGGRQAYTSTYASRLRTGATLLMQPILSNLPPPDAPATGTRSERAERAAAASSSSAAPERPAAPSRSSTRRGAASAVNYTEPDSDGADFDEDDKEEDEKPDKGAANDGEFQASGGVRTAVRRGRLNALGLGPGQSIIKASSSTPTPANQQKAGATSTSVLEKSYLGLIPPQHFAVPRPFPATKHEYLYVFFYIFISCSQNLINDIAAQKINSSKNPTAPPRSCPSASNSKLRPTASATSSPGTSTSAFSPPNTLPVSLHRTWISM